MSSGESEEKGVTSEKIGESEKLLSQKLSKSTDWWHCSTMSMDTINGSLCLCKSVAKSKLVHYIHICF